MQTPLQITIRHMAHSDALTTRVHEEVGKLSRFYPDIVGCRVVIEQRDRHKRQGRSFNVRIALCVPGHELIVNHDHDEDVYVALRDAFASLTRRLEDVARRQRGTVKKHASVSGGKATPAAVDQDWVVRSTMRLDASQERWGE
jgi:ribosomal subunit interface protein